MTEPLARVGAGSPRLSLRAFAGRSIRGARRRLRELVVRAGTLRRLARLPEARLNALVGVAPLSELWGHDRGAPIHRHYLERFLEEYASDIRGHCLEFQEDSYATRYGGRRITKLDILHIDDTNPRATIVADLTKPNAVPSDTFDCIICTHVLHLVGEVEALVRDLYRILAPGGVLLVASPALGMCQPEYAHESWRYFFTTEGLQWLLERAFARERLTVRPYGNSLTAAGELRGLVVAEFTREELGHHDARFPVEICARAVK